MGFTVRDIMQADVKKVNSQLSLSNLEREFIKKGVSGFPVVDSGRLVGIVSRSDIVRQLCVEQTIAESVSDYQQQVNNFDQQTEELEQIATRVGRRINNLHVKDMMITNLVTVLPEDSLEHLAKTLFEKKIHRVLVCDEGGGLLGIVSTLDLVGLIAKGEVSG